MLASRFPFCNPILVYPRHCLLLRETSDLQFALEQCLIAGQMPHDSRILSLRGLLIDTVSLLQLPNTADCFCPTHLWLFCAGTYLQLVTLPFRLLVQVIRVGRLERSAFPRRLRECLREKILWEQSAHPGSSSHFGIHSRNTLGHAVINYICSLLMGKIKFLVDTPGSLSGKRFLIYFYPHLQLRVRDVMAYAEAVCELPMGHYELSHEGYIHPLNECSSILSDQYQYKLQITPFEVLEDQGKSHEDSNKKSKRHQLKDKKESKQIEPKSESSEQEPPARKRVMKKIAADEVHRTTRLPVKAKESSSDSQFLPKVGNQGMVQPPPFTNVKGKKEAGSAQRKCVILRDSSPQSSPSEISAKKKAETTNLASIRASTVLRDPIGVKAGERTAERSGMKPEKIPQSVRNRSTAKQTLQSHKEKQWVSVPDAVLKQYELQKKVFLVAGNSIRFKVVELDQEKFIPVLSDWIEGEVLSSLSGQVTLAKVVQKGNQFAPKQDFRIQNMSNIEIHKIHAQPWQIQQIAGVVVAIESKPESKPVPKAEAPQTAKIGKDSVQSFVCGQAHYYFGDKNYSGDLYMQMHANRRPDKYIPIEFLLNFPKIKKVLRDEATLARYLAEDEQRHTRSYEFNDQLLMIRKKVPLQVCTAAEQKTAEKQAVVKQKAQEIEIEGRGSVEGKKMDIGSD